EGLQKKMQGVLKAHQLARVLRRSSSPILLYSVSRVLSPCILEDIQSSSQWRGYFNSGTIYGNYMKKECNLQRNVCRCQKCSVMLRASFSTEAGTAENSVTESVKELYDKILKSVVDQRSAPPNAWLWSLIQSCANREDANLLFDILQRLRIFRLSNLRIHENFNCALCQEITKACVRVGAVDLGKKVLWKHSVYGLTPNIGSAHHLLLFAKQHNDVKLLVEIMNLVKKNDLILQPGTADIVFRVSSLSSGPGELNPAFKWRRVEGRAHHP
ncbi:hypothetical protein AABB24_012616, partial [Solanum stoloniferum]